MDKKTPKGPKGPKTYNVGYGSPPKQTQFKPGQSGNPKGRPKGTPTLQELFLREGAKLITVKTGAKVEKISKMEVFVRRLFQKGIETEMPAARILCSQLTLAIADEAGQGEEAMALIFGSEIPDEKAVKRIAARLSQLKPDDDGGADAQ